MAPILIVHIAAGVIGILSGAGAAATRKGGRSHRLLGTVFVLSMLGMAALGAILALALPQMASVAVAGLTAYLAASGWAAVRRPQGAVGAFDKAALGFALVVASALLAMAAVAARSQGGRLDGAPPAPYLVFAAFALFAAGWDVRVIARGGVSGRQRLARHLWRMCLALFFACAFFFLGQQKAMPPAMRGSPLLFVPAFAPLVVMAVWLVRVRLKGWTPRPSAAAPKAA